MTVEATRGEVAGHAMKLEEELEHTKRVHGETTERLVSRSADVESVTKSLVSFHNDEVKGVGCFVLAKSRATPTTFKCKLNQWRTWSPASVSRVCFYFEF